MPREDESSTLEAEHPLNVDDMLRAEEEEDEEIIEAAAAASMVKELPLHPSLPPPSISPPPPSPQTQAEETRTKDPSGSQTRAEEARMGEPSDVRTDLPPSCLGTSAKVPWPNSPSSGQADDLMEYVQRLLGTLKNLTAQPAPLTQQAMPEASRGLASLLGASRQLRAFLDLPCTEALSL